MTETEQEKLARRINGTMDGIKKFVVWTLLIAMVGYLLLVTVISIF